MDRQRLRQLYEQHADVVYRVCYTYLNSSADSEDAVQEVFLRLMKKDPVFENERDQRSWLIVTACNYCKSQLRWRKRHPVVESDSQPEQSCIDSSDAEILDLLAALPDDCRQVVIMHCCEGYTLAEIARMSGMNPSTVRSRWFYARKKLKNILGGIE